MSPRPGSRARRAALAAASALGLGAGVLWCGADGYERRG
jgi:hypothetical protein